MRYHSSTTSRACFTRVAKRFRQLTTLSLIGAVLLLSIPSAAAGTAARSTLLHATEWTGALPGFAEILEATRQFFGVGPQMSLPQENRPRPRIYPTGPPRTRYEREARVRRVELNVARQVTMRSGQVTSLAARAIDDDGETIQGLAVKWESSDQNVIFVRPDGHAAAGNPGSAQIRARAGSTQDLIQVTVIAADAQSRSMTPVNENASRKKQPEASTAKPIAPAEAKLPTRRSHAEPKAEAKPQQNPPDLPAGDVPTLYEPRNAVGSPPNRYFPSSQTSPAANRNGRDMPGSDNYTFSVPITNLPGRGLDVSLALNYNSSLWNKSGINGNNLTFDVDKCWPTPGFRLGYGYIAQQNGNGLTLVDSDGTRHQLLNDSPYPYPPSYITNDGTFTRVAGFPGLPNATYSDGTQVFYGAWSYNGTNTTYYPTKITDRHGNYITINYQTDAYGNQIGPRITSIFDTLGRSVLFKYDSANNLVTVTAPGYANGADRQEVRFYYETITDFTNKAKFASNVTVNNRPSSIQVIKYIYFPGTQMAYSYDYSPYGMIRQIKQLRAVTVSTASVSQTGTVNPGGQLAATTTYGYPETTPSAGLTSAPTYNFRTDNWTGNTAGAATTAFEVGVSTKITAPDGTYSETISDETGDVTEIKRTSQLGVTTTYARTKIEWGVDQNGYNRRVIRVQSTIDVNQPTEKTKAIGYTYTDFNNVDEVIEYNFNTAPDTPGPILRRTKTTYVADASFPYRQAYIARGLMRLPTSVQVFAGTSLTPISRVDFAYDEAALVVYPHTGQDYIINYDESYDPEAPVETFWDWLLDDPNCEIGPPHPPATHCPCCPAHWGSYTVPVYDPATAKRGNLTSVKAYADAATLANPSMDTMTYDISGNVITETANCCQQRNYTYTSAYQFAYPETVTYGSGTTQLTKSAVYDYNTGALRTSTDENNQTKTLHYDQANLRLYETVRPDGGTTDIIYFGDMLFAAPDATHTYSAVMTVTSLDAGRTVRGWQFSDGSGNVARTFGENAGQGHIGASYVEYDQMGRVYRVSNPYYAVYGGGTDVNPTGLWTTYSYDPLGRPKTVTLQDQDLNTVNYDYSGVTTTFTDQAGKQRRQTLDALDRVVQLDEPDSTGALTQSTTYQFDASDNLTKITQGTEQNRYFKYDSLSRLTYERQVEQDAPYYQTDATGNNYWSRKVNYNADNLITDSWDARGIQTHVTYDDLNRVSQITYTGEAATTTTPTVTYSYDEQRAGYFNRGRLTTVTTAAGGGTLTPVPQTTQALDYDRIGRVQSQRQTVNATTRTLGYTYNLLGQLQSETYPSGRVVSTSVDAAARLSAVSDVGQSYANAFAYAGHGGLASETWGNGAVHTVNYNNRLQVSQIKLTVGGAEKQRFDYQYGEVNVDTAVLDKTKNTGQVAVVDGWIDGGKQWQQRYAYDKLGRLSTAKELSNDQTGSQTWRVDYTFDRWGNRYQAAGQGGVPVIDSDINKTRNRFVTVGSTQMIYDAAGNLTIDQKFRGMQFTYDANGRMRRTDAANGYTTTVYDGAGQRVQTFDSITNITRQSLYDANGRVVTDYENGVWKRDYVYRGSLLLATVEASGGTRYVLTDHQGSTRAVMNNTQIVERHDYKPFGEELGAGTGLRTTGQGYGAQNPLRQQYALTERDSSTGLNHAWFRKSDSLSGRWTSPDPYQGSMDTGDPQSFNRYTYVGNDPINTVDPSGLGCIDYYWSYYTRPHGSNEPWVLVRVEYAYSLCNTTGQVKRVRLPPGRRAPLTGNGLSSVAGNDLQRVWQRTFDDCKDKRKSERERMRNNLVPNAINNASIQSAIFGGTVGAVRGAQAGATIGLAEGIVGVSLGVTIGSYVVAGAALNAANGFVAAAATNVIVDSIVLDSTLGKDEAKDDEECKKAADEAIARLAL